MSDTDMIAVKAKDILKHRKSSQTHKHTHTLFLAIVQIEQMK